MNNIVDKYGINDKTFKDKKILFSELSTKKRILVNNKYYFKLEVNKQNKKIYLLVFDYNFVLIGKNSYIDFETLKNHLEIKLRALALIFASKKSNDSKLYFRYYKITLYELISFEKFIDLIEKDIIKISIIGRISRSGPDKGRQRNKNLVFKIKKQDIKFLFKTIYEYNYDEINNIL